MMNNKKAQLGSEMILWIFRIIFLVIVSIGVTAVVSALYTQNLDIRKIEALSLTRKISDCISVNGFLNENILKDTDKFLENCKISLNEEFFVKVNITNPLNQQVFSFKYGENLEPLCKTTSSMKYKPECLESNFNIVNNSLNREVLKTDILVAIKKFDKNLK